MDPYEDDDGEFLDVPDLNSRTWRHPSEVAAGLAASRPLPAEDLDTKTSRQPHLVGAVVAAAICTMGLVFGGFLQPGMMLQTDVQRAQIDQELGVPPEDENHNTTQSTEAVPATCDHVDTGLYTSSGTSGTFLARYVVIDGMLLTSASALDGRKRVIFRLDLADSTSSDEPETLEMPVEVVRVSTEYDLAVLALPEQSVMPVPEWSPETEGRDDGTEDEVSIGARSDEPVDGEIMLTDVEAISATGSELDGLVQTSIPAIGCAAGSPVTNIHSELVGMTASTTATQTLYVPMSQLEAELALVST